MDLAVRGVGFATHPVPADRLQTTPEGARFVQGALGIAHQQMAPVRRDDSRFECQVPCPVAAAGLDCSLC